MLFNDATFQNIVVTMYFIKCTVLLNYLRLCAKKANIFSLLGFKPLLFFVDMLPAVLKKCST